MWILQVMVNLYFLESFGPIGLTVILLRDVVNCTGPSTTPNC